MLANISTTSSGREAFMFSTLRSRSVSCLHLRKIWIFARQEGHHIIELIDLTMDALPMFIQWRAFVEELGFMKLSVTKPSSQLRHKKCAAQRVYVVAMRYNHMAAKPTIPVLTIKAIKLTSSFQLFFDSFISRISRIFTCHLVAGGIPRFLRSNRRSQPNSEDHHEKSNENFTKSTNFCPHCLHAWLSSLLGLVKLQCQRHQVG